MNKIFVDSNIWVYMFSADDDARNSVAHNFVTQACITDQLVVSYQVINEVTHVLKRKGRTESMLRDIVRYLTEACEVIGFTPQLALRASELREKNAFSFWDSHIVAAALSCDADVLASEDMNDWQKIGNLTIRNIFV